MSGPDFNNGPESDLNRDVSNKLDSALAQVHLHETF